MLDKNVHPLDTFVTNGTISYGKNMYIGIRIHMHFTCNHIIHMHIHIEIYISRDWICEALLISFSMISFLGPLSHSSFMSCLLAGFFSINFLLIL